MDENDISAEKVVATGPLHLMKDHAPSSSHQIQDERRIEETELKELLTDMSGDSGSYGVMFDLETPQHYTVTISSLDILVNIEKENCPVRIYYKDGTHRGYERKPDDWTLVVDGLANCRGFDKRTSIPSNLFTEKITVPSGKRVGMYVSLSTPNIRYSKPTGPASSTSDDYLTVYDGTGMGGLFDKAFYPRIFNGVITYSTEQEKSMSLGGSECKESIHTTADETTSVHGHMFDIIGKSESSLYIKGLEFRTNLKTEFDYFIYTLPKSIEDAETDLSQWTLVSSGKIQGKGPETWTRVPSFNVKIPPKVPQGFYVSFKTADMLTMETSTKTGRILTEDTFVSIMAGIDVYDFPLRPGVDRSYNNGWYGRLYYSTNDALCDLKLPPESTDVVFTFVVKHQRSYTLSELLTGMKSEVSSAVSELLQKHAWLLRMRRYYNLEVDNVGCILSDEDLSGMCIDNKGTEMCTTVSTTVSFLHQSGLNRGNLIYTLLKEVDQIILSLESSGEWTVLNAGDKVHETTSIISLVGVPQRKMGINEQTFYQDTTKSFLQKFLNKASVDVLNVAVTEQSLYAARRHLLRASSGIDITTVVTGKHRPPPELDFPSLVNDAVNDNSETFRLELTDLNYVGAPGNSFFEGVKDAAARPTGVVDTQAPTLSPTVTLNKGDNPGLMSGYAGILIMVAVAIFVFALVFGMFVLFKRHKYMKKKGRKNLEDERFFANLTSRNNDLAIDELLDTEVEVVKPVEPKENEDDDCATTTDMTMDSKRSRHSEIRDAIMSQEAYNGDVKRRAQEDPDGEQYEGKGYHDYGEKEGFRPPRFIGLTDDRGRTGRRGIDDHSEITFGSSTHKRKTAQQLEEESYDKMCKEKGLQNDSNNSTPEFGQQEDYDSQRERQHVGRRHSADHCISSGHYADRRRTNSDTYSGKGRLRIDDLEAEYEDRIRRKNDLMDCGGTVRSDSSGRTGRRSVPGTNHERYSRYGKQYYNRSGRELGSSNQTYYSLDRSRRSEYSRSYERSRPDLVELHDENTQPFTHDPPAHRAHSMSSKGNRSASIRDKKKMAGETLISNSTNSTLSTKDLDI